MQPVVMKSNKENVMLLQPVVGVITVPLIVDAILPCGYKIIEKKVYRRKVVR